MSTAMSAMKLNAAEAAAIKNAEERKKYLYGRWMMWLSWAAKREINAPDDLKDDELDRVLVKAKAGEVPK